MATNTTISNAAAIAACDAIVDRLDEGASAAVLRIYADTQPTGVDCAVDGQVLCAELTLNDPAFGAASDADPGGRATADVSPVPTDSSANATDTATWFRVSTSGGTAVIDGSVGTSAADLILNTVSIVAGAEVTLTAWTFTVPES